MAKKKSKPISELEQLTEDLAKMKAGKADKADIQGVSDKIKHLKKE